MKAFTVYQPYAHAIVTGRKGYETRPRKTNIRGRVAVHAGAKNPEEVANTVDLISEMEGMRFAEVRKRMAHWDYPCGAVVGTVEIVDCVHVEEIVDKLTPLEKALGDYSPGRFAWVLQNPIMFDKPIPARGQQGWWNWPFVIAECPPQIGPTERPNYKIVCGLEKAADKKEGSQ